MKFRNEVEANLSNNGSVLTRIFGNIDKPVNFCFEYQLRNCRELLNMNLQAPIDELLKEAPFQVEIKYTRLDGSKHLRVVSCLMPISHDKENLEDNSDPAILA